MDNEVKEFLAALQKKLVSIDYIKTEDIPNIGLYMEWQNEPVYGYTTNNEPGDKMSPAPKITSLDVIFEYF